jgi:hypothetical protein
MFACKRWQRLLFPAGAALLILSTGCARASSDGNANVPVIVQTSQDSPATTGAGTTPENDQQTKSPDDLVREFYAWYLGELRGGKEPFKNDEKMKQYVSDKFLAAITKAEKDTRFDPVLLLETTDPSWHDMKVEVSKPKFYKGKPYYDAYVNVKYKTASGRKSIDDDWSVGLSRTANGWRIESFGIND